MRYQSTYRGPGGARRLWVEAAGGHVVDGGCSGWRLTQGPMAVTKAVSLQKT